MYITIASLTINNNATTFTINSGEDISGISPNSILYVAGASLPTQVSWENGAPKLAEAWSENTFTAVKARIFVGIQGVVDAVDSAKAVSNNLNAKTDEVNTIIAGQGTAATKDVTTSSTDASAGRILKVGDFGVGGIAQLQNGTSLLDLTIKNGVYYAVLPTDTPNPSIGNYNLKVTATANQNYRQIEAIGLNKTSGIQRRYINIYDNGVWLGWSEIYHAGNINNNVFGGISSPSLIARGFAASASVATFSIELSAVTEASSATVEGSFYLRRPFGATLATGISAITFSGVSTNKYASFQVSGLSGLTTGEPLELLSETSNSKITVNF